MKAKAARTHNISIWLHSLDRRRAISWHILEVLKERKIPLDNKVHKMTFNEVTQKQ